MASHLFRSRSVAAIGAACLGAVALSGATSPAHAAPAAPNTWSGTTNLLSSDDAPIGSAVVTAADGTQWVIAASRYSGGGNAYGAAALSRPSGGAFPGSPTWLAGGPSAVDGTHSVLAKTLAAFSDGNDVAVAWQACADSGASPCYLGGARYSGGSWTTADYEQLSISGARGASQPGFALLADGRVLAAYGDNAGAVQTAILGTDGTWSALTAIPGATYDTNGYQPPALVVGDDGEAWVTYPGVNTPMAVKWAAGTWGTPESVRGASPNADYDPSSEDRYALALTPAALGPQQPIVIDGESVTGSLHMYARDGAGTWTGSLVTDQTGANVNLALAIAADGSMGVFTQDYNETTPFTVVSPDLDGPWEAATALTLPPGARTFGLRSATSVTGDLAIGIPTQLSSGGNQYGEIYLAGLRAGSGAFTAPALVSTETATTDNQGADNLSFALDSSSASLPMAWTSYANSARVAYSLFWTDASSALPAPPGQPTDVTGTGADGSVDLGWTAPTNPGTSAITGYEVRYSTDGGVTWSSAMATGSTDVAATVSSLTNGTEYIFQVRAVNSVGPGWWSNSSAPVTPESSPPPPPPGTAPSRPNAPTVLAGKDRVTVTVERGTGGGKPLSFTVTASPGGKTCTILSSSGGSCAVTGLTAGVTYTFTATASNAAGTSGPSAASQGARIGSTPAPSAQAIPKRMRMGASSLLVNGRPARVGVTPNGGDNGVDITGPGFTMTLDGLDANGRPLDLGPGGVLVLARERDVRTTGTGFMPNSQVGLYLDPPIAAPRARTPRAKGTFIGTLRTDASGSFSGTATLPAGIAPGVHDLQAVGFTPGNLPRVLTLGVLVTDVPGRVQDLGLDRLTAAGTAIVDWKPPLHALRSPVTAYVVSHRVSGMPGWMNDERTTRTRVAIPDLAAGCSYDVRVRAVGPVGKGPWRILSFGVPVAGPAGRGDVRCVAS